MLPIELAIVKGIPVPPGHTTSSEAELEVVNLLDARGIALNEKGWTAKRPQHKSATTAPGLYGGKQPTSYSQDSITENITLIASGVTRNTRDWLIMLLERIAENARAFHAGDYQLNPVYLKARFPGASRTGYSSIFNINIAPETEVMDGQTKAILINITIERETAWWFLAPGENPKIQTYELAGTAYDYADLNISVIGVNPTGSNLFDASINNGSAHNGTTFIQTGHVDIDAEDIPGDMPAAVQIAIQSGTGTSEKVYVATRSVPLLYANVVNIPHKNVYGIQTGDYYALGADTTSVADANTITGNRATCTFATTITDAIRIQFGPLEMPVMAGRYAAFVRAYQSGGVSGNVYFSLGARNGQFGVGEIRTNEVRAFVGSAYYLHYVGIIEVPIAPVPLTISQDGLYLSGGEGLINLYARRPTSPGELRIADLVLMPVDENYVVIISSGNPNPPAVIYDSTRYFTHGHQQDFAGTFSADDYAILSNTEAQGGVVMLNPGVKNRIYFLRVVDSLSAPKLAVTVKGNVVSRWSGAIDV